MTGPAHWAIPFPNPKKVVPSNHVVTSPVALLHLSNLMLVFWECMSLLRRGVEKASAANVLRVWHLTCKMTAAAAAAKALWCNEMPPAGLLAHDTLFYHHLGRNDPLLGDAPVFGDARFVGDALLSHCDVPVLGDGARVFDDDSIPHNDVSEASDRTSHIARAVSSGFSQVVCCWIQRRWVGYS